VRWIFFFSSIFSLLFFAKYKRCLFICFLYPIWSLFFWFLFALLFIFSGLIFFLNFIPHHLDLINFCIKFYLYFFHCYLFFYPFSNWTLFSISSLNIWFQIIFIWNLVFILFIAIFFVWIFFFIVFSFQFHPSIFFWFKILFRYFLEFAFYEVSVYD
jgi:hypothetical protein